MKTNETAGTTRTRNAAAATDVAEFITDLDGGQFEELLSIALSRVSAAVVDHEKKGKVSIAFDIQKIPGTHQVRITHQLKFSNPTSIGTQSEDVETSTVLHVGKGGALSIAQTPLFGKQNSL